MENNLDNSQEDGKKKQNSLHGFSKSRESPADAILHLSKLKPKRIVRKAIPQCMLILNIKQSRIGKNTIENSLLHSAIGLGSTIPKHIVSLDEKYLRRCLELINISASKPVNCNISLRCSSHMDIFSGSLISATVISQDTIDVSRFSLDCSFPAGPDSIIIRPAKRWMEDSITGSKDMVNISQSPLLCQFGSFGSSANFTKGFNNIEGSISYNCMNSPSRLNSSQGLEKETVTEGIQKYTSKAVHRRHVSTSSTNSSSSDHTSSSAPCIVSQGMLQCTWRGGIPHFVFSVDEHKEVYIASLSAVEATNDKALDYVYLLYSKKGGQMKHDMTDKDSQLVGKMKVSTSLTLCPCSAEIMETEFVLFGDSDSNDGEAQNCSHSLRKNRRLSKKVVEVFRNSHSSWQRSISRFGGTGSISEDGTWEPFHDASNNLVESEGRPNLLEDNLPPNYELAAIVVKDHLPARHQDHVGGWGLTFLKKAGFMQDIDSLKPMVASACCAQSVGDCSTSMDVLVPAGFHGGPRIRNGGPSSLTDRWRSGGHCDCGGWDLGCPLTVLKTRSIKEELLSHTTAQGVCKSFDLFVQGSEHCAPSWRMVNVHDGLYLIHFQSILSTMQSFSIAVAYIHTRSPTLRPKIV